MKKKKRVDYGSILKKKKLRFKNQKELEEYYFEKYRNEGGYKKKGLKLFGINVSNIYHRHRFNSSFEFLNPKKDEIILDAGCGTGELTKRIAKKCFKIIGIDISRSAIAIAKKKASKNCKFKYGNIEKLEFPDNYFDKVICVETLEHLLKPKIVLREFKRVLKSEGQLVLCVPTIDTTTRAKIEKFFKIAELWPVSEHLHEWDFNSIKSLTEKQGFKFIQSKGIAFDFGIFGKLGNLNKTTYLFKLKLSLSIKNFPRNSTFVSMLFQKIK